ncbi:MAG: ribonuclease D [Anaerolineaceae bacterium]|nr:ribonuclease D [Anaerolineaceae bacterium]
MVANNGYIWVNSDEKLSELALALKNEPIIAVDTESNSLFAYDEQVCLLQFSTPTQDYLVDTLALMDLSILAPIFSDASIEKIFHAAEYDVICLKRDFGFEFEHIFDTMIGARTLGWTQVGLGSLLESLFDVKVNKKYQRTNWSKRPLDDAQLDYARTDTHYLINLRDRIKSELMEKNRWEMAREDFQRMCQISVPPPTDPIEQCWRSCNKRHFNLQQQTVLYELCAYREKSARRANLPPFKVLSKNILSQTAENCPRSIKELKQNVSISDKLIQRHGKALISAVRRGLEQNPIRRPKKTRKNQEPYHTNLDRLREWRKNTAKKHQVESDVILSRDLLEQIAATDPKNLADLESVMASAPHRFMTYGASILDTLSTEDS